MSPFSSILYLQFYFPHKLVIYIMTPLKYSITFTHITRALYTLLGAADGDETGWHPLREGVIEHLHFQRRRYPALPVLIMLSTRIDSIRTVDFTRLRFPPPPPPTWQRPSPSSDLRATLSFPQSRRDNQYAKSNPVQHGRFAVMQNGPNVGVFDSRRGLLLRAVRETRGPRVCKTEPGKLRNDQFIIFVGGRPRPLTDAHKLRNSETPF